VVVVPMVLEMEVVVEVHQQQDFKDMLLTTMVEMEELG
jgi:hypothetical protein